MCSILKQRYLRAKRKSKNNTQYCRNLKNKATPNKINNFYLNWNLQLKPFKICSNVWTDLYSRIKCEFNNLRQRLMGPIVEVNNLLSIPIVPVSSTCWLCNLSSKPNNASRAKSDNAFSENSKLYYNVAVRQSVDLKLGIVCIFRFQMEIMECTLFSFLSSLKNTKHVQTEKR